MIRLNYSRNESIKRLKAQIRINGHIIGVAAGSGMTMKCSIMGGADFVLALSAGRFRQSGRASLGSYLCYSNSNETVNDFASRELLPLIKKTPILFGLNATDPNIDLYDYIRNIKNNGFTGINNFPTVGLIDGQFREALEEEGISFAKEIEAIRIAHKFDLVTLAFVFDEWQTEQMILAGADIICSHLGLTTGGFLGAKKAYSIDNARMLSDKVFKICNRMNADVIKMVYGGPIKSPIDARYFYDNTGCQGFIGGSSFERIPSEKAIMNTTRIFRESANYENDSILMKVLAGEAHDYNYVEFIKDYIRDNYERQIYLGDLALAAHISAPYLSTKFKQSMGCSFTEYLIRFRMNKACELLTGNQMSIGRIAELVGYNDYAQFAKTFKKYKGIPPSTYRNINHPATLILDKR